MISKKVRLLLILFGLFTCLSAQVSESDIRISSGELKMTFPSIYFKYNSAEYAEMPYSVDSCFQYIIGHLENLNSFNVWRDSSESEALTEERIGKLQNDFKRFNPKKRIKIRSMGASQKLSQRSIYEGAYPSQVKYLLSLNSVFDVSATIKAKKVKRCHCFLCWIQGNCRKK